MLEATATANNVNAINLPVGQYKDCMNHISGPDCTNYIKLKELEDDHRHLLTKALSKFDSMATFGSKESIDRARQSVFDLISKEYEVYVSLNEGRNPLAGLEIYIVPLMVGFTSYVLKSVADFSCSSY